jgi:hypothetical protein
VSLEVHLKAAKRAMPLLLQKCIDAVERRGLRREGIYRISPKLTEVLELKRKCEKDISKVDLLDERAWDIHTICTLVKLYLRELPEPLLDIPVNERATYMRKDESEKIAMIQYWMKPAHKTTLQWLVHHLAR